MKRLLRNNMMKALSAVMAVFMVAVPIGALASVESIVDIADGGDGGYTEVGTDIQAVSSDLELDNAMEEGEEILAGEEPPEPEPGTAEENIMGRDGEDTDSISGHVEHTESIAEATDFNADMQIAPMRAEALAEEETIKVIEGVDGAQLVDILVQNSSLTIVDGSVSTVGENVQRGSFTGGGPVFGISSGIILSTGKAVHVQPSTGPYGPNANQGITHPFNNYGVYTPGDKDLDGLINSVYSTTDASVLTFEFIPDTNYLAFKYVFASEEYNEYIGVSYSTYDVFGFFINGKNYALVPDTGECVSIKTINHKTNKQYFINNNCHDPRDGSPVIKQVDCVQTEMDGFTVVMNIIAPVNKDEVNTIKLAIADGRDYRVDSVVLIADMHTVSPTVTLETPENKSVSETGGKVTYTVKRDITIGALDVGYRLVDGTAKTGEDYQGTSGTVRFADGEDTAEITINIVNRSGSYQGDRSFSLELTENSDDYILGKPYKGTITILETDKEVTVTQRFLDASGTKIKNDLTTKAALASKYTAAASVKDNFTEGGVVYEYVGYIMGDYSSGKTPQAGLPPDVVINGNLVVCFIYQRAVRTVTQRFLDASGTKIKNDLTTEAALASKYTAEASVKNNFTEGGVVYEYVGYIMGDYSSGKTPQAGLPSNVVVNGNLVVCFIYQRAVRTVTVSKTVKGSFTDLTKEYSFTIYLMDSAGKKLNSGSKFNYTLSSAPASGTLTLGRNGEYTFALKHGQSITIEGVASNGSVQIIEEEVKGYITSYTETVSRITKTARDTGAFNINGENRTFAFTNEKMNVPPAGISDVRMPVYLLPIVLLAAGGSLAIAGFISLKKSKKVL